MQVKICGLTRPGDAAIAEQLGAAYLGTILAGGPRLVTLEQAQQVLGPRRTGIRRVAVFGDQSPTEVARVASQLALDVLQLHHAPTAETVHWLRQETGCDVWPVVRVTDRLSSSARPASAAATAPVTHVDVGALTQAANALVLDAMVVGQLGGTGVTMDWVALADDVAAWRQQFPNATLVVAGGLRPHNVVEAIRLLSPTIVDVSSGVEQAPGVKDPERMRQFVEAAQRAAENSR